MSFLLDTNVISEIAKPRPDPSVLNWLASVSEDELFLSVITVAELRHGVEKLASGHREAALDAWLTEQLPVRFGSRLLVVDATTADHWGRVVATREAVGRPTTAIDALIAASALQHQLVLATRNTSDFESMGLRLFNPWASTTGS